MNLPTRSVKRINLLFEKFFLLKLLEQNGVSVNGDVVFDVDKFHIWISCHLSVGSHTKAETSL